MNRGVSVASLGMREESLHYERRLFSAMNVRSPPRKSIVSPQLRAGVDVENNYVATESCRELLSNFPLELK